MQPESLFSLSGYLRDFITPHNGRRSIDRLILKVPLFGDLIMMTATAQFCRIFSSLTRAGVPILMAMEISSQTAGNSIISDAILESRTLVQEGVLLSTSLIRQKVFARHGPKHVGHRRRNWRNGQDA
jgi:type IV pilus assembly protein PilC